MGHPPLALLSPRGEIHQWYSSRVSVLRHGQAEEKGPATRPESSDFSLKASIMTGVRHSEFTNRDKTPVSLARLYRLLVILPLCCPALAWAQTSLPTPDDCGSPLLRSIYERDVRKIQRIIDSGSDLNFKGCEEGTTPLIESIGEGLPEVAKELILAGADPNLADNEGVSPLMVASWYCRDELVSLLLKRGVAVNATDTDGKSALMNAAYVCGGGKIVSILLKSGAAVNLRTKDGETSLTIAAFSGNESAVRQLVAGGADLDFSLDRIAMHVVQFFSSLPPAPNVEIIESALPQARQFAGRR